VETVGFFKTGDEGVGGRAVQRLEGGKARKEEESGVAVKERAKAIPAPAKAQEAKHGAAAAGGAKPKSTAIRPAVDHTDSEFEEF
jgi:hypothetical protein